MAALVFAIESAFKAMSPFRSELTSLLLCAGAAWGSKCLSILRWEIIQTRTAPRNALFCVVFASRSKGGKLSHAQTIKVCQEQHLLTRLGFNAKSQQEEQCKREMCSEDALRRAWIWCQGLKA